MLDIPRWLKHYINTDGVGRIQNAITRAEATTRGEIVPMIVHRSSHVGHAPYLLAALGSIVALVIAIGLMAMHFSWWHDFILLVAAAMGFIVGLIVARLDVGQRFAIPFEDRLHQVERRAELEFYEAGLNKTAGQTGVLLFVSIMERRAVVLADQGISSKLPVEVWTDVVEDMTNGIRQGDMASGMIQGIQRCGDILSRHFPPVADDKNELMNRLIIKE